jgi:hypothetical protein
MSLFFEDVEIKRSSSEVVVEDVTGLINVTLESEMAWHNLTTEIMKEEFSAVINEDEEQAEGAKQNLFKKILQFFKDAWNKFVQVVNNLVTRLQAQFGAAIKYAKPLNAKLSKYEGGAKATVHDWKTDIGGLAGAFQATAWGGKLSTLIANASSEQKTFTADEVVKALGYDSFADMDKDIVSKARSTEASEKEITKQDGAGAISNIMGASKAIKEVKAFSNSMKKVVDTGRKEAMEGLNAKDPETKKKKVASTATARVAVGVINKALNVMIKLVMECFTESVRVVKACSAKVGGDNKAQKQADKDAKKQAKQDKNDDVKNDSMNESIFDLTLEDFEDEDLLEEVEITLEDFDDELEELAF